MIAVFYKHKPTYNPVFTKGIPLHGMGTSYKHKQNKNSIYNNYNDNERKDNRKGEILKYPTSIINIPRMTAKKMVYPTQKPVELLEYLIKTYTNEDDLVLDNCMGSGSTGLACKNLNRNFIGIEKSKEAFDIAKSRLI